MLPLTRMNAFRGGMTAVTAACALTLGVLPAAAAVPAGRPAIRVSPDTAPAAVAYTYGNKPSSHGYTPEKDYSYNSTGGAIGITRAGLGEYSVTFYGMGPEAGQGTVDVTPEGLQAAVCSVVGWHSSGANLVVGVDCFAVSGARANEYFEAAFTSGGSTGGTTDYVYANQPASKSYTPVRAYQFNSSGGINTIKRLGAGDYEVIMPGPDVADGTVKVTSYGTNADACQVVEWLNATAGQDVYVDCFNKSGVLTNDRFTATFTASNDLLGDGGASGYLWANDPTASSYTPNLNYQWDTIGNEAQVLVLLLSTGEWENDWPDAGVGNTPAGDQQASAYGSTDTHCIIDGPAGAVGEDETGDVFCFDNGGNPVGTYYTTQWLGT
jgi:hypothetical protein